MEPSESNIINSTLDMLSTTTLPVMESFYTIQGEGFYQGRAAYFLRLGGCDVGCTWCDVKESWDADAHPLLTIESIIIKALQESGTADRTAAVLNQDTTIQYAVEGISTGSSQLLCDSWKQSITHRPQVQVRPLIVVTGGEPLLHNLDELTHQLHLAGFETNIETSGSSPLSGDWDWICLSPKKFKSPLKGILAVAHELKVVIFNKHDFEWAEQYAALVSPYCKLYLQPEWSKAAEVTPLIINYIKAHPQWELSLQIHKYINIP